MMEQGLGEEARAWKRKIDEREPFFAEDNWALLTYLFSLHTPNPLSKDRRDLYKRPVDMNSDRLYYRLSREATARGEFPPGTYVELFRERSTEDIHDLRSAAAPISGCVVDDESLESFFISEPKVGIGEIRCFKDEGQLHSISAGASFYHEQYEVFIHNNAQNADTFGLNLAHNLWDASQYTLEHIESQQTDN